MIMNQTPYPISFEREMSQALVCRYGEEMRQYVFKPDIDVSGLSCLLQIAKTDGTFTENGVEVHTDPDTGECTLVITIPQQATVVKGLNRYSICVYGPIEGEDHLLYSAEGPLWVDDNLITDDMIASVAEVNGLVFPQDFLTVENLVDIVNYVRAQLINDNVTAEDITWSSDKIKQEITGHVPEITGTADGNPITINDAAAAPLYHCTATIEATQDLHGYDKPWPPGAGKNKLPLELSTIKVLNTTGTWIGDEYTLNGVTYSFTQLNGYITSIILSGTATADSRIMVISDIRTIGISIGTLIIVNGCPANGATNKWFIQSNNVGYDTGNGVSGPMPSIPSALYVSITNGINTQGLVFKPMIRLATVTDSTFQPYSNICPVTGLSSVDADIAASSVDTPETFSADLGETVYGGFADLISGEKTKTWGYIASYNGESLPGEWMSDRDEYVPGTTPTTGAEVAYELSGPLTGSISPTMIKTLLGNNYITTNAKTLSIEYVKQAYDPLIYHGKIYSTNEQIVGKWIDGKDINEITLEISSFSASTYDNNWYYGLVDLSTYGITPEHVFPDCAASYITLADTTTRTPVYIDWQGGSNVYPYFIGSRSGNLTLTLRYTKQ